MIPLVPGVRPRPNLPKNSNLMKSLTEHSQDHESGLGTGEYDEFSYGPYTIHELFTIDYNDDIIIIIE